MQPDTPWTGRLWLGHDYGLIHGMSGRTAPHSHYAHQLILAPDRPMTVLVEDTPVTTSRLLIASQTRHAILEAPDPVFTVYAEPLRFEAWALRDALFDIELSLTALDRAMSQCPRRTLNDPRIERALATVDASLSSKVAASAVAEAAHLSMSQLQRLFVSQVGLPVRRMVLWRRLRLAIAAILAGHAVTDAAHAAGFADSAHFSRSLKKLFGVTARQALQHIELRLLD
ncbi:helix-turn-helix transcriptional regulator [Pseudomonas sp. B2M1-30]|uniref:helix-turn-helix transcriptional regulator n=1 Tax=Pseudomonas TaxID=286 RepID=UPI0021CAAF1F|nr:MULTISPECIES: helix-turn-helix transcriptional regulator [Pseudomonas]MCU0118910.1 helix-turn-helix transcriptional regulator [Pseudomonas sp. B2M1-30]MCU7263392.1 helix-turn-helix transcriptional regulator [Pseudomonas koreensis]